MAHNTACLMLMMIAATATCCSALMLPQYARQTGGEYEYAEEEEPQKATLPPNHITRIVHPSEIRVPQTLEEFTKVVGAEMTASLTNQAGSPSPTATAVTNNGDIAQRQEKALTYTELNQLLAMWQLEKERNAYEMQLDRHRHSAHAARTN